MTIGGLREELRQKTAHLHREAEAALDLMNPALPLARYREVLRLLHSVHTRTEPAILAHPGWAALGLDMPARRKLPLLEEDLAFIESRLRAAGEAGSPVIEEVAAGGAAARQPAATFSWLDSFPAVLGAAYVVEGSTLGGVQIHRHLARVLGLGEGPGARFFACYGDQTGPRWKELLAAFERASLGAADTERAVAGAVHTFQALIDGARPATSA